MAQHPYRQVDRRLVRPGHLPERENRSAYAFIAFAVPIGIGMRRRCPIVAAAIAVIFIADRQWELCQGAGRTRVAPFQNRTLRRMASRWLPHRRVQRQSESSCVDERFEITPWVQGVRKPCQRAFDDLLGDVQRRIHFGLHQPRRVERHDSAFRSEAGDQDDRNQADQAKSKRRRARRGR